MLKQKKTSGAALGKIMQCQHELTCIEGAWFCIFCAKKINTVNNSQREGK